MPPTSIVETMNVAYDSNTQEIVYPREVEDVLAEANATMLKRMLADDSEAVIFMPFRNRRKWEMVLSLTDLKLGFDALKEQIAVYDAVGRKKQADSLRKVGLATGKIVLDCVPLESIREAVSKR